jgi:hypothetical protein
MVDWKAFRVLTIESAPNVVIRVVLHHEHHDVVNSGQLAGRFRVEHEDWGVS